MKTLNTFGLSLLLLAAACAKTTAPDPGTNTNWLKACVDEADCDAEDACVCGVCTKPCSEDDQCGDVHAATSCEPVSEAACGASSEAKACLQGCDGDRDCTSLEHGRCVASVCVPEVQSTPDGGTPDASDRDALSDRRSNGPPTVSRRRRIWPLASRIPASSLWI